MSLSTRSRLSGMHPYMAWAIGFILDHASNRGAKFSITSVNRTASQQWDLYRDFNRVAAKPGCSQHQYGLAADVLFERSDWQNWYLASVRNFGLVTVSGDPVHVQGYPGDRFREGAGSLGLCPDPSYAHAIKVFDSARAWRDCLLRASRTKNGRVSCALPCGPVYGIPC